ncbi:MAG: translation initiation factor IF-1 [Patescibacteria group bacterium]
MRDEYSSQSQAKEIKIGLVTNALPNTMFRVEIDEGKRVLAHMSGKMRLHHIKVLVGDRVKIEMDEYNPERAKIIQRL